MKPQFHLKQGYWWVSFGECIIASGQAFTYQQAKEDAVEAWVAFRIKLLSINLEFAL